MFSVTDRQIFGPYFNGAAMVYADPLAAHRRIVHELDGDPNVALGQARAPEEPVRFAAREKLLAAARSALSLVPFDPATGTGALESDVWAALNALLDFLDEKKNPGLNSPTSVPNTGRPESSDPDPFADLTVTPSTSPSPSTSGGCGCVGPTR